MGHKYASAIVKLNSFFIYTHFVFIDTNLKKLHFETNLKEADSEVSSNKAILQLCWYEELFIIYIFTLSKLCFVSLIIFCLIYLQPIYCY